MRLRDPTPRGLVCRRNPRREGKCGIEEDVSTTPASVHVIDDDDSFRRSITRMLEAAVFLAAGYSCAGDFMLRYLRGGNACILLDITMPGPNGIDLLKAVVSGTGRLR